MHQRALGHLDTRLAGDEQEATTAPNPNPTSPEPRIHNLESRIQNPDQHRSQAPSDAAGLRIILWIHWVHTLSGGFSPLESLEKCIFLRHVYEKYPLYICFIKYLCRNPKILLSRYISLSCYIRITY